MNTPSPSTLVPISNTSRKQQKLNNSGVLNSKLKETLDFVELLVSIHYSSNSSSISSNGLDLTPIDNSWCIIVTMFI